jgi:hypothetical protein
MIKGFKGFNRDLTCNPNNKPFQYEISKEYEVTEKPVRCTNTGFHFCENPIDIFGYYSPVDSRYCEVEGDGEIDKGNGEDTKVACSKLKIGLEIGLRGVIEAGVKFILEKVDWKNQKVSNDQRQSAATNTGYRSAATNTGYSSAATNTGYRSAATNTGYSSAATNTGDRSAATNTGDRSAATNTGYSSAATNTGYRSAATNTGDRSAATNTGDRSAATNTGDRSAASVEGKESIACGLGIENKAKGALGCWIVLTEWYQDEEYNWHIKTVKTAKVDGKKIKADTWYKLENGKFVETEE